MTGKLAGVLLKDSASITATIGIPRPMANHRRGFADFGLLVPDGL
jgi:hypothetical protein